MSRSTRDAFARRAGGKFLARVGRLDGDSPYLMAGHLVCARCRGPLGGMTAFHGNGPTAGRVRVTYYGCTYHTYHRKRGRLVEALVAGLKTEEARKREISERE